MPDFLLELGFEEIPARMISRAQDELAKRVGDLLLREGLLVAGRSFTIGSYSTPRRLAIVANGIAVRQADTEEQLTGPAAKTAFKDGQPTAAAHAFAKKVGVDVSALKSTTTAKGDYVTARVTTVGRAAAHVLAKLLPVEIAALSWPKAMYWRPGKPERMVRPLRWMVALLDSDVVPLDVAGVPAGNQSFGHRVMHGNAPVKITSPQNYIAELKQAFVEPDPEVRRHAIRKALDAHTRVVAGTRWREDQPLLETVVHLTEWPSAVLGSFEPEHLQLPEEVLVTVMRDHQKYFAVEDAQGKLAPHFLAVLNTHADDDGAATIRHGNARVLRARFNDARFFWDADQKISLSERVAMLGAITFHKHLGTYGDKTQANVRLASALAADVSAKDVRVDVVIVAEAARLAKADLTTELVKEFTELQGIVGGLYARAQGVSSVLADAIYDQYNPSGIDGPTPRGVEGAVLALADRANTIVDMFAIGLAPSGSKDPFALRRAANGVVKILAQHSLPLTLSRLIHLAAENSQQPQARTKSDEVKQFLLERLAYYMKEVAGLEYDVIKAVLAAGDDDVRDAIARGTALAAVRSTEDFSAIAGAFKRIKNILAQASSRGGEVAADINAELLIEVAEQGLNEHLVLWQTQGNAFRRTGDYPSALDAIAKLRPPLDAFFDSVMVMAPDPALRANRLALLSRLQKDFSSIADFSEIVTVGS